MKATLFPILAEVLMKNQPEGVQLCVKQVRKLHFIVIDIDTALILICLAAFMKLLSTDMGFIYVVVCFFVCFFSTRKQIIKPGSKQDLSLRGLLQKLIINVLFKNVFHNK